MNWLSTDLYECEGKAQTNFELTMPSDDCDLARQIVKDPQNFKVFGLKEKYPETELKAAIVANIESTLLSFGKGVVFLGREYPVEVGGETKNIDPKFLCWFNCPPPRFISRRDAESAELLNKRICLRLTPFPQRRPLGLSKSVCFSLFPCLRFCFRQAFQAFSVLSPPRVTFN